MEIWQDGFKQPRFMLLGPSKEILLADSGVNGPEGAIYVLQGKERKAIIERLTRPYGLALHDGWLYVGEPESVKRYKYDAKAMTAPGRAKRWFRSRASAAATGRAACCSLAMASRFCVGTGSGSNVSPGEDPRRAAINCYNPDGSGHEIYASGTRNPIGLRWYPGNGHFGRRCRSATNWVTIWSPTTSPTFRRAASTAGLTPTRGRMRIRATRDSGPTWWPRPIQGDVLLGSHVAVLDFLFYTGTQFPKEYQGGAFLAFHGSWNRSKRVGQSMAFIPFKDGKPSGPMKEILTGWMVGPDSRDVWGRPVGLLQLPDGSLLISEDGNNRIWHLSYKG